MIFSTVTTSGVFVFVPKDSSKKIDKDQLEFDIINKFNKKYDNSGISLSKYSNSLQLAFVIHASSTYTTGDDLSLKHSHPLYSELIITTGTLSAIADEYGLKCTRAGT